jgi:hypothetical protein
MIVILIRTGLTLGVVLFLLGCGSAPPRNPEMTKPPPEVVKPGVWEGFLVSREGTVRIIGWIEPIVSEENVWYDCRFTFTSDPAVNRKRIFLFLDPRESGIELGVWVKRRIAVVGRVTENAEVGYHREPGWDTKRKIKGTLMRVTAIDVP